MTAIEIRTTDYSVYDVGNIWRGNDPWYDRLRVLKAWRLGRVAQEAAASGVKFRMVGALPIRWPRILLDECAQPRFSLQAVSQALFDKVACDFPGKDIRPAIMRMTPGGHTIAGPLPDGLDFGRARLELQCTDGVRRVLATPVGETRPAASEADVATGGIVRTVLSSVRSGSALALPGVIADDRYLIVPHGKSDEPPVESVALTTEVATWARISRTPIM